ncbi:alkaline phosphatase family protein, partial [Candidatus Sumerlaeota bacterium]|nr:alkaline phosphatase family protein [Candidatus Sumerlaeota bacterium]
MPSILYAADPPKDPSKRKVIIFGIDGMDPKLLDKFVAAGKMPNFKRLISEGSYKPLTSSAPPLSPTAWSTFITGMDPGGHGIFDFV